MTQWARHKRSGRIITPEEFVSLEGAAFRDRGIYPSCPVCDNDLHPYGVHSISVTSRFDHPNRTDCPLSSTPDPRFKHLRPAGWDFAAGEALRREFCEPPRLREAYAVCRAICFGRLRINEFVAFCKEADRKRVWAYKDLPLWVVPYILTTLADLEPEQVGAPEVLKNARRFPLRFVLKKKAKTAIDEMWRTPQTCSLAPVFADSGKPMSRAPIVIGDDQIESTRCDVGWISDSVVRGLRGCCGI